MLFLGLSVPGEVPRCSASVLVLLAGFLNSARIRYNLHDFPFVGHQSPDSVQHGLSGVVSGDVQVDTPSPRAGINDSINLCVYPGTFLYTIITDYHGSKKVHIDCRQGWHNIRSA